MKAIRRLKVSGSGKLLRDLDVEREYGYPRASTLRHWRIVGGGPRWRKLAGAVVYTRDDIDEWIAAAPGGGGHIPRGRVMAGEL